MQTRSIEQLTHVRDTGLKQLLSDGDNALNAGDIARAENLFRRAVQIDVRSAEAWRALAKTQYGARQAICLRWAAYAEAVNMRTAAPPQVRFTSSWRLYVYRTSLIGTLGAGTLALLLLGGDLAYQDRVLPGVFVGPVAVGNLSRAAAEAEVTARQQRIAHRSIVVRAGAQTWQLPIAALLENRTAESVGRALRYGHEPAFWSRAIARTRALLGGEYVVTGPRVDVRAVQNFVAMIAGQIQRDRRDAQLAHTAQGWTIVQEQAGRAIDQGQTIAQLTQFLNAHAWQDQAASQQVVVEIAETPPVRTAIQLEPLRQRLQQLSSKPLALQIGGRRWTLDRSMLIDTDSGIHPAALEASEPRIMQQLDAIASAVAVDAQPSRLVREADRVRAIVSGVPGHELDREAALQRIKAAVFTEEVLLELPMREVPPPPGEVEQLGLIAELGRGESQFQTYSSPARDANVQAGGNDIDGVLIAPGDIFSFTQTVGSITWEKGYRWGEMIEAGVVVPSLGGGICQVSTTTFRAAFWSGLEIIERHNHSWRLPWYEVDAPPGMDATIALGGPDLKFRNNTQHHILIKVETDLSQKRQTVIVYGTPDGRKVEMQPLAGSNIGVQRYVLNHAMVMAEETFISHYSQ